MNEDDIKRMISYSDGGILSKAISKKPGKEVTLFCMARGTEMSEHTSTRKATVYVIEGAGTFNLMGKRIAMLPGVTIRMGKNDVHSLKAHENMSFLLRLSG